MDEKLLQALCQNRFSLYSPEFVKALALTPEREQALVSFYASQLVTELKRKPVAVDPPQPLLGYKIIESAVQLFQRYYLLNRLEGSNPKQMAFVAAYLALKMEHVDKGCIEQFRERFLATKALRGLVHFGQDNYSPLELQFLVSINYELDTPSIFRPLESLLHALKKQLPEAEVLALQKECIQACLNVLCTPAVFRVDLPLAGLAVFVSALRRQAHREDSLACLDEFLPLIRSAQFEALAELVGQCDRHRLETRELILSFQAWNQKDNNFKLPFKRVAGK